jgi:hypothetical protein
MKEPKSSPLSDKTYDVVESAIDRSKELRGTWDELMRKRRFKPWASETRTQTNHDDAPPLHQPDSVTQP